jgi:hypothetical protein
LVALLILGPCHSLAVQQDLVQQPSVLVPGKRWAIVIGANNYTHFGPLKYANKDAKAFAACLTDSYGFTKDNVRLLTDDSDSKSTPTAGNILGELETVLADPTLSKNDLVVFYFAGHGVGTKSGDFLLPTDARQASVERVGVPVREVVTRLSKAGLRNVLFIADACRSGESNDFGKELRELTRNTNICFMLASEPGKPSHEDPQLGHGVFSFYLVDTLRAKTAVDPVTGAVWASHLAKGLTEKVGKHTARDTDEEQRPYIWAEEDKDVLLKLDAAALPADKDLEEFAKTMKLKPEIHLVYLVAIAEEAYRAGRFKEAFSALKALGPYTPTEEQVAYLYYMCASQLGHFGMADRVRTSLLKTSATGLYVDELVLSAGKYQPSAKRVFEAFKRQWAQKDWLLQYLRISHLLRTQLVAAADVAPFIEELRRDAGKDKRKLLCTSALADLNIGNPIGAEEKYKQALAVSGDNPNNQDIVTAVVLLIIDQQRVKDAAAFGETHAGKDMHRLMLTAELYGMVNDKDACTRVITRYLETGLLSEHCLQVLPYVAGNEKLSSLYVEKLSKLSPEEWRVRVAQTILQFATDNQVPTLFKAFEAAVILPEEAPGRCAEIFEMFLKITDNPLPPEKSGAKYQLLMGLSHVGATVAPLAGGHEAFWRILVTIQQEINWHFRTADLAQRFMLKDENISSYSPGLLASVHAVLLQCFQQAQADRIKKLASSSEFDQLAHENEVVAAFSVGDDALARKLIASRKLPASATTSDVPSIITSIARYYDAVDAKGELKLSAVEERFSFQRLLRLLRHIELQKGKITDQEGIAIISENAPHGYLGIYLRLHQSINYAEATPDQQAAMERFFAGLAQTVPGLKSMQLMAFAANPSPAQFVFNVNRDVLIHWNGATSGGKLALDVSKEGKVTGFLRYGADEPMEITGAVDALGNLTAQTKSAKFPLSLAAKLLPMAQMKSGKGILIVVYMLGQAGELGFLVLDKLSIGE